MKQMNPKLIIASASTFLLALLCISLATLWYSGAQTTANLIDHDLEQLSGIFSRIHETCQIIDFDYQQNRINFLNTIEFAGSEVGPMNLVHPDRWEGPYVDDNPTIQKKSYMVVKTHDGYFITPGDGVKLPNGKVIGKDVILDESADIPAMILDPEQLRYQDIALAVPLERKTSVERLERP